MYLICKIKGYRSGMADVLPVAFAYDEEAATKLADEIGGMTVVLDTNFRIALESAIYKTKQVA